jgi:hypothetical protein
MSRETFLLLFVLGAATLALWIMLCLPRLAPRSLRGAAAHVCAALLVSFALAPALHLVPGLPGTASVFGALFGVALPALTYMLLAGLWFLQLMAGDPLAGRR